MYLAQKVVGGFCEVAPLTQERVRRIAHADNYSGVVEGQVGWKVSLAKDFLLPWLKKNLPDMIRQKIKETEKSIQADVSFPKAAFHSTLQEINTYYSELINAYRKTAHEPYFNKTVEKSVEEKLEQSYASQGKKEGAVFTKSLQKIFEETLFKETLRTIPWPFGAPLSLLFYTISFTVGHILPLFRFSLPKTEDPIDTKLDIFVQIAACRFLKELKKAMNHSQKTSLTLDKQLLESFLQQDRLVSRLHSCSSQEQIKRVLNDNSTLQWIEDRFLYGHIAKQIETMVGTAWSIIERPSWRERETKHFLRSLNDFFENPDRLLAQSHDIDAVIEGFLMDIMNQKLPTLLDFAKQTIAQFALTQKAALLEKRKAFWLKSYNLRFGLLHHQIINRWLSW